MGECAGVSLEQEISYRRGVERNGWGIGKRRECVRERRELRQRMDGEVRGEKTWERGGIECLVEGKDLVGG